MEVRAGEGEQDARETELTELVDADLSGREEAFTVTSKNTGSLYKVKQLAEHKGVNVSIRATQRGERKSRHILRVRCLNSVSAVNMEICSPALMVEYSDNCCYLFLI
ncbi:unnamed protein product [Pleuronectes platessa]|uniref:Uncharacterized protein n=1 Tax=Pleuronectes platessa TaxID=8262 RepID=A0A9N7V4I0_PLEPL|nr:unnamed protein product [Pleuronectes platessa]